VMTAPGLLAARVPGFVHRTWGPTPSWDQKLGGGAMLGIAECVGLPFLGAVLVAWVRADDAEAKAVDAELDRQRAAEAGAAVPGSSRGGPASAAAPATPPQRDRPWWETDPRIQERRR